MEQPKIDEAWQGHSDCRNCGIRDLVLFADLDEPDFAHIHQPIDDFHFPRGVDLYQAGEPAKSVYTIRDGVVKLTQYLPNGRERIVRLLRQGDVAGLEGLFGQPYDHTATTLRPTLTCRIPCAVVQTLNAETPRVYAQLMERWRRSVARADEWLTALSTGSARARVARLFLHLLGDEGQTDCHMFSREDVGAILGITTETASRIVAEFRRGDALRELRPNLFRCNREALEKISLDT